MLNIPFYVLAIFGNDARVEVAKSDNKLLMVKIFINAFLDDEATIEQKVRLLQDEFIYGNNHPKEALDMIEIRYIFVGDKNGQLQDKTG